MEKAFGPKQSDLPDNIDIMNDLFGPEVKIEFD
jgi:hypothetical protein